MKYPPERLGPPASARDARHHVSVDDDAAAHARADRHKHAARTAARGARPQLAHGSGVRIVLELHRGVGAAAFERG